MNKLDLSKAITALLNGKVIVYPTDTLYGLGADIFNEDAVKKIFDIKKRPLKNPLPIAVSDFEMLEKIAFVDERSANLISSFLPGKLTLILSKKDIIPDIVTGGLEKIAVRIPDNEIALDILSRFGPITATSANIHGNKTPEFINDIAMQFSSEDVEVFLDVGRLEGQPSTIVDASGKDVVIVREGAIKKEEILDAI
ncbi:MAG: threonylcarbamoyl-AMP synthase [Thermoplasmatales archaeon]|nr:threonylcarbamoyl-AMP synthase [Thermoplasmatales archaeon]